MSELEAEAARQAAGMLGQLESVHVFILSGDGAIRACNDTAWRALGRPRGELLQQPIQRFLTSSDGQRLERALGVLGRRPDPLVLNFCDAADVPYTLNGWLDVTTDGCALVGEWLGSRDQRPQRELMEVNQELAVLARERAKAADNERRARDAAEAANRSRNNAVATIVHELRQPLGPLAYALAVLRTAADDRSRIRALDVLDRQAAHLTRLVNDLLDASRAQQGKLVVKTELVELDRLVREAVEAFRGRADKAEVSLAVSAPPEALELHADPARIHQVLSNLLENAIKFSKPGGRVEVEVEDSTPAARISVRDSGRGIAPEVLPHVFELFAQQSEGEGGGLGIGLAVSRAIVAAHGGTIEARSGGSDQGAEFLVSLPARPVAAPSAPPSHDDGSGPQ